MTAYPCSLELIQSNYCLIRHLPNNLPEQIVHTHQMARSPIDNGYVIKLNMLNSLKRLLREIGIQLPTLPNVSFKMHRPINKQITGTWSIQEIAYSWKLYESQVRGIKFFISTGGRCIIGDEWAMGKTITALAIFEVIPDKKMLIACPRVLLSHWIQHLYKHYGSKLEKKDVTILYENQCPNSYETICDGTKIILITYEYMRQTLNENTFLEYKKLFANYSYLICDQPQTIIHNQFCKKILKIPLRVILLSDSAQKWFIELIPIVNPKIQQQEMRSRYLNNKQVLRELQSTTLKYYYIKTCRKFSKPPVHIKPVSLYGGSISTSEDGRSCDTISQKKLTEIIQYSKLLIQSKGIQEILLIYLRDQIGSNIAKLLEQRVPNYKIITNFSKQNAKNPENSTIKSPIIIISHLEKSLSFSQSLTKQSRAIFIELPHRSIQNQSLLLQTTNKLYLICQKIQYFTFRNSFRFTQEIQNYNVVVPRICFDRSQDSIQISSSYNNNRSNCLSDSNASEEKEWKSNAKVVYYDADASGDYIVIQNNDSKQNLLNYDSNMLENKTQQLNSDNMLRNLSVDENALHLQQQKQIKIQSMNQMKMQNQMKEEYNEHKDLDEYLSLGEQFANRKKNQQFILKQLTNSKGKKLSIRLIKGVSSWKKNEKN